jgi:hypothetical protein
MQRGKKPSDADGRLIPANAGNGKGGFCRPTTILMGTVGSTFRLPPLSFRRIMTFARQVRSNPGSAP